MPRSASAYLADIVEACDAIEEVLRGVDYEAYSASRSTRSSVERELITIGEAAATLRRDAPDLFARMSHGHMVIGMRNVLTHDYAAVDDETVFGTVREDVPVIKRECSQFLEELEGAN